MNTWALTPEAFQEPWRLWSCHLVHPDWRQTAVNGAALAVPMILVRRKDRLRAFMWLFLLAPILSLVLMLSLRGETHCGLAGLACAAWTLVGLQLLVREESLAAGLAMLGLLGLKFTVESLTESGVLVHGGRWQAVSDFQMVGTLLGLVAGTLDGGFRRVECRMRCRAAKHLRKLVTVPR
jgi:membrane associated rhomboid family serine protease